MEKFTLFWNGPFSQWLPCSFIVNDIEFNCAEQFMMFYKALFFDDLATAAAVMETNNPRKQKALGRKVKGFDVAKWAAISRDIVRAGSIAKFTQSSYLRQTLVDTYPTTLVEASPYDKIWGIGLGEDNPLAWQRKTWEGKNWLGEVLTKVRDDIMNSNIPKSPCAIVIELNAKWNRSKDNA